MSSPRFNQALLNIYKQDDVAKRIAGDIVAFVDDHRTIGHSLKQAQKIARWMTSKLRFLGVQDAPRKSYIDNGPWVGCLFDTKDNQITSIVKQEKLSKGKVYIHSIAKELVEDLEQKLEFKRLERIKEYMCHLTMVYVILFSF